MTFSAFSCWSWQARALLQNGDLGLRIEGSGFVGDYCIPRLNLYGDTSELIDTSVVSCSALLTACEQGRRELSKRFGVKLAVGQRRISLLRPLDLMNKKRETPRLGGVSVTSFRLGLPGSLLSEKPAPHPWTADPDTPKPHSFGDPIIISILIIDY